MHLLLKFGLKEERTSVELPLAGREKGLAGGGHMAACEELALGDRRVQVGPVRWCWQVEGMHLTRPCLGWTTRAHQGLDQPHGRL
uniref:Uncharacterized protein n=1 Tax=Cannabis sativa TaxID=3483 RepID=A0A803NUS6_CANSA